MRIMIGRSHLGQLRADIDSRILEEAMGDYALPLDGKMILLNENGEVLLSKSGKDVQWEVATGKITVNM
ncbi:MAG: hypothetical protein ACLR6B_04575 [Blautia sp.]